MTNNIVKYIFIAFAAISLYACYPDVKAPTTASKGQADFSKYIAVGNSLTSGYANGGLYLAGQKVAYPNLIAGQMVSVGGGAFTSPFLLMHRLTVLATYI
jgi:hypothetical protein